MEFCIRKQKEFLNVLFFYTYKKCFSVDFKIFKNIFNGCHLECEHVNAVSINVDNICVRPWKKLYDVNL